MHSIQMVAAATLLAASAIGAVGTAPATHASKDDFAINGKYRATSIGVAAKYNEVYRDEATVISTWTISSTCTTAEECSGTMTSDQGWSAPLSTHSGYLWFVKHDVPNWETCPDGSSFTGQQIYHFYPVDVNGGVKIGSPTLAGTDKTTGPSGACGANKSLVIDMPFRLDKIG
jgi:hypothetical protein